MSNDKKEKKDKKINEKETKKISGGILSESNKTIIAYGGPYVRPLQNRLDEEKTDKVYGGCCSPEGCIRIPGIFPKHKDDWNKQWIWDITHKKPKPIKYGGIPPFKNIPFDKFTTDKNSQDDKK